MVEPLAAAAVANELSLLDFIDQKSPQKPCNRTETALKNPNALVIFDELLDSSVDSIAVKCRPFLTLARFFSPLQTP